MAELLQNIGLWFALGIIVGIILEFAGRLFFERWFRPTIKIPKEDEDVWWEVYSDANLFYAQVGDIVMFKSEYQEKVPLLKDQETQKVVEGYRDQTVRVYRLKVRNKGKRAAENVAGTVEFKTRFQGERRICWYEGNLPTITLNAEDHSFLDVYGVLLSEPGAICMPTENGWTRLHAMVLNDKVEIRLRVTAKNAPPCPVRFGIDPKNHCKPYWLD